MRNGKIATMPERVREELNGRMEKGESSKTILAWMNEEPNPGQKPIPGFDRVPISKQNLSQWRRGGFREWQIRRRIEAADSGMKDLGRTVEMAPLAENLLLKVMGLYAVVVNPWDGKANEGFEAEVRILRGLLHDATLMQRAVGQADKLKEAIRRRKREREDLWGGGGLVEAMREMLRKKREERINAEAQRREDAKEEKDRAEAGVKDGAAAAKEADCSSGTLSQATGTVTLPGAGAGESELVAPGQSESHLDVGLDSAEAAAKDGVVAEAAKEADCSSGTLSQATGTVTLPGAGAGESELVAPGQSESHLDVGLDSAEAAAKDGVVAEAAKEADCSSGTLSQATGTVTLPGTLLREDATAGRAGAGESELVAPGQSDSNQKGEEGGDVNTPTRGDAKYDGDLGEEGGKMR